MSMQERKPKIHEDCNGNIYITEVTTRIVTSEDEVNNGCM